jgi:hypothetical protein
LGCDTQSYYFGILCFDIGELLVTPEVHPHALAMTARCLREMLAPLVMKPIVKVMVPEAKAMMVKIFLTQPSMHEAMRCD